MPPQDANPTPSFGGFGVRRGQRPADPPLRLRTMKDSKRENKHNRREKPDGDETLSELLSSYTPKQREAFLKGFRILAKVAVRAHIERQAAGSKAVYRQHIWDS